MKVLSFSQFFPLFQVNGEIEMLRSSLKSLKTTELEKTSELNQLQKSLESTKLELTNKQSVMEQQIGALRFQLSSQQMEADIAMQVCVNYMIYTYMYIAW